ncbi:MAG: hypothetical protein GY832_27080, partial [Chloroflexi bacterium]|nr:hypothetical protein [Chloroflexota bacterium]
MQEVLDQTAHLVPEGSPAIHVITLPDQVISPLPTLPTTPQPDPLKAPLAMPDDIMDSETAPPEKAAGVYDIDMTDTEPTVQAAAVAASAAGAVVAPLGPADATAAIE